MNAVEKSRRSRKAFTGEVLGRFGDKSIKVAYSFKSPHAKYVKEVRRKTVVYAHDEKNECQVGDYVKIEEVRPMSKLKRWRVVSILQKETVGGI
ncbi:MAG: 30S ribosomal protein S17 [Puniceicoccales bacterium]|jgi:small subunit ribosomal protein S17|nr:30S ribosomal protein S17 [Puniceicoccales bacterium]